METNQAAAKATHDQTEDSGFALQQALLWIQRCYSLGFREMVKEDDVAAANVQRMVANGEAQIVARVDLAQQSCSFLFCQDSAGENASELQLFANFFAPAAPTSDSIN